MLHRDIKPANILIDDSCTVHLCDFGLARVNPVQKMKVIETTIESELTSTSSPDNNDIDLTNKQNETQKRPLSAHISSRWYRSPELILTIPEYDDRIDIWGLGCVIAEFLLKIAC